MLFVAAVAAMAQQYPSEWVRYTSDGYFHDIESSVNKQEALDQARTNLARQIQVRVAEVSQMEKNSENGRSSVSYSSIKTLSTNVDMNLSETKSYYDASQGKHYVIVFIDKAAACTYYENEVKMLINNTGNVITIADNYIGTGFKSKAKTELENALRLFDKAGNAFLWLNVFGLDDYKIQQYLNSVHGNEQSIKQKIADLEYGTTYCVICEADMFGKRYVKLANEVKGELSAQGCNFVNDAANADIVINISASARKYNQFQGAYFTYVDAVVSIDKTATGQRIFEDEVSIKGAHTLSYDEAARDGYKQITKEITKILKENIKQ